MFFKNLFKRFKDKKGVTGGDVAIAASLIAITVGVVTAIYVNVNNKIKENIRYSNGVRMATQIIENIQSKNYDYLINYCNTVYSDKEDIFFKEVKGGSGEKLFEVNVPTGYTANVTTKRVSSSEVDVIRDITVTVTYKVGLRNNSITLYTVKKKELLEQSNKPELSVLKLLDRNMNCYPVKEYNGSYYITDANDPEWYNYDNRDLVASEDEVADDGTTTDTEVPEVSVERGTWALVCVTPQTIELGAKVNFDEIQSTLYTWIPRFGVDADKNLLYCYGTSGYKIGYNKWTDFEGNVLYGYMLCGSELGTGNPEIVDSYVENTFVAEDGLSGVWYNVTEKTDNSEVVTNIKNEFVNLCPCKNITF